MEKLIRHRIPALAAARGETLKTRVVTPAELRPLILRKIHEEVAELEAATSTGDILAEVVDVLEACLSYARVSGIDEGQLRQFGSDKFEEKGTFDEGIVLVTEPDA